MHVAFAAAACAQIVFEIGITTDRSEIVQRRASEIGMQHDAGGVDDLAKRWGKQLVEPPLHDGPDLRGVVRHVV